MTTPTDMPIEDRLRAHFADRTAAVAIPGPEHDTRVADVRAGRPLAPAPDDELGRRRAGTGRHRRRRPLLVAAAAAVVVAIVTGVALSGRGDPGDDVRTDSSDLPAPPAPSTTEAPPTTTVTEDSVVTPPPAATPPPSAAATGPIVVGNGIVGTWDGSAWVPWRSGDPVPADQDYQLVELGAAPRVVRGTAGIDCSPAGAPTVDVGLGSGGGGIAVAAGHTVLPRTVSVERTDGVDYSTAARQIASTMGVDDPEPIVRQVVRADLDGDGVVEVLVVAGRGSTDPGAAIAGDWSVAFVFRVVNGVGEPQVLDSSRADPSPDGYPLAVEHYEIVAVADVNGDGSMEAAIEHDFWESGETVLYEAAPGGSLTPVLSASCGA